MLQCRLYLVTNPFHKLVKTDFPTSNSNARHYIVVPKQNLFQKRQQVEWHQKKAKMEFSVTTTFAFYRNVQEVLGFMLAISKQTLLA